MKKGDKVYFAEEKSPYTVRACNALFAVCTKVLGDETLYTAVDFKKGIRGMECTKYPYQILVNCSLQDESDDCCKQMLKRLTKGATMVYARFPAELHIVKCEGKRKVPAHIV